MPSNMAAIAMKTIYSSRVYVHSLQGKLEYDLKMKDIHEYILMVTRFVLLLKSVHFLVNKT